MWVKEVLIPSVLGLILLPITVIGGWDGHVCWYMKTRTWWESYCAKECWFWCDRYAWRERYQAYYIQDCCRGWRHNGDQNCNIAICIPDCKHGGKCVAPNECECPHGYTGRFTACDRLECSHLLPCYPGTCQYPNRCDCDKGFIGSRQNACLTMTNETGMPVIALSTVTLAHVRRTDNSIKFAYSMDGTSKEKDTFWSNQKNFNHLKYEFESIYTPPSISMRPTYVHASDFGIVDGQILLNISKIPRLGGPIRDVVPVKQYNCPGLSYIKPRDDIVNCTITDNQFSTNIEHGDW